MQTPEVKAAPERFVPAQELPAFVFVIRIKKIRG
jgi:hypothetical protein